MTERRQKQANMKRNAQEVTLGIWDERDVARGGKAALSIKNYTAPSPRKHIKKTVVYISAAHWSKATSALGAISETNRAPNTHCLGMLYLNAKQTVNISLR